MGNECFVVIATDEELKSHVHFFGSRFDAGLKIARYLEHGFKQMECAEERNSFCIVHGRMVTGTIHVEFE